MSRLSLRHSYQFLHQQPESHFTHYHDETSIILSFFLLFQLTDLGISPELLSVTSSNASSFRFDGRKYFSEAVLSSKEGVRNEDGGVLHAGTDGSVGLGEIQR